MRIQKTIYFCLVVGITALLLYSMLQFTTENVQDKKRSIEAQQLIKETNTIRIYDLYDLPGYQSVQDFLDKTANWKKCSVLYQNLVERLEPFFMEFYDALLQWEGEFSYDKELVYGYGDFPADELQDFINQKIEYEGGEVQLTNLKGWFLGKNTCDFLHLEEHLTEGEIFSEKDYLWNDTCIPVILGYGYTDMYSLGDQFTVFYLGEPLKIEVKGFFGKGTIITLGKVIEEMDTGMLLPAFNVSEEQFNAADEQLQHIFLLHYLYKTGSYILINEEADVMKASQILTDASQEGLEFDYEPVDAAVETENILQQAIDAANIINLFTILETIILIVILSTIFMIHFRRNRKDYAIHLICGATLTDIKRKLYLELGIRMAIGYFLGAELFKLSRHREFAALLIQKSQEFVGCIVILVFVAVIAISNVYMKYSLIYLQLRKK